MSKARVSLKITLLTPLVVSAVVCSLSLLGLLDFFIGRAYDLTLAVKTEPVQNEKIIFIDVDDKAVDYAGTWPIRRDYVADALILSAEMGLSYIIFDIEYVDNSPSTVDEALLQNILPEKSTALLRDIESNVGILIESVQNGRIPLSELAAYLPDVKDSFRTVNTELQTIYGELARNSDEYLGMAAEVFGSSYFTVNLVPGVMLDIDPALMSFYQNEIALKNIDGDLDSIHETTSMMPTIESVIKGAEGAGFPNVIIDGDGVRRRVYLLQDYEGDIYGQLAFSPVLSILGRPDITVKKDSIVLSGIDTEFASLPDQIRIPLAQDGSMLINWPHADYLDSFTHISFGQLLEHNKLLDSMVRNLQIREDMGYLESYRGRESLNERMLRLSEMRRTAVFSGDRMLLGEYGGETEAALKDILDFFDDEYSARFKDSLAEAHSGGRISNDDYAFVSNDFPVWFAAVKRQAEDLVRIRSFLKAELSGKMAIIGNAATGTTDIGVNPFSEKYINIGTHAAVANTILQNDFLDDSPWYFAAFLSWFMSFGLAFLIRQTGPVVSGFISFGLAAAGAGLCVLIMSRIGVFVSPVNLLLNNIIVYAAFTIIKFSATEKEKGFIKNAFSHYLSEDVISEVLNDPDKLSLGGEKRYLTAMFTDVKGFSTISEQLDPQDLVSLLNRYLGDMSDVVLDERGTIDKYEGDAIIAFFGAPVPLDDHAERACRSAVLMKRIEMNLNKEFLATNAAPGPLLTRIGINSGDIVVGNMGTVRKMNYTMMGNAVNLAARLEGVNKQYGTWILISDETRGLIGDDFLTRMLDRVRVVGINTPVRLYELVEIKKDAESELKELVQIFENGLQSYENRDFINSEKMFKECLKLNEHDQPSTIFLERSKAFLENEPEEDWDAVINLTSK